jgi:hypothetical protein
MSYLKSYLENDSMKMLSNCAHFFPKPLVQLQKSLRKLLVAILTLIEESKYNNVVVLLGLRIRLSRRLLGKWKVSHFATAFEGSYLLLRKS